MKRSNSLSFLIVVALSVLLFLAGCGVLATPTPIPRTVTPTPIPPTVTPNLVGKWRHIIDSQSSDDVGFLQDGTVVWGWSIGKYSLLENNRIQLETTGMVSMVGIYTLSISGDTLTMIGETGADKGKTFVLQRIK